MHKKEVEDMMDVVEQLEKENLEIMSELFECQVDDLKISRSEAKPQLIHLIPYKFEAECVLVNFYLP